MKFVLLTQYYPPEVGGAQVLMASLAVELKKQGHEVRVVTAMPNYPTGRIFDGYRGKLFHSEILDGIQVFRTWVIAVQTPRLLPRLANYFSFCISCLLSWFWMGKPDILFVDSPPLFLAFTARWIARLKGSKWVMNVSDLWPDAVAEMGTVKPGLMLGLAQNLERYLYKTADFVSTVTEGIHEILIERKDVPREKVLFLPIGVDTELFQPRPPDSSVLEKHGLSGKTIFLYAGTIGLAQGLSLLLDAGELLKHRTDIALVCLGDGPMKTKLQEERDRRGLKNVTFIDPVPLSEMPRWWSVTRAALVTLTDQIVHKSARPSKSLPALSSGVPVIFSGSGEMARIIADANAGIVVAPEQVQPLVDSITALADSPELARGLGENGRQLCERELSWSRVIRQWLLDLTGTSRFSPLQSRQV